MNAYLKRISSFILARLRFGKKRECYLVRNLIQLDGHRFKALVDLLHEEKERIEVMNLRDLMEVVTSRVLG
jgi:hypothetical protein